MRRHVGFAGLRCVILRAEHGSIGGAVVRLVPGNPPVLAGLNLPVSLLSLLNVLRPCFTAPGFATFCGLVAGLADSDLPEGAAGDYLVWYQAIEEAARRDLDLVLVTGDEKEDWWWRHRSEFLGPRVELVAEFKARCGRQLYMMRPIDLLRRSSALDVMVSKESVDDVERVSRESQRLSQWPEAGVAALLERLQTEGRDQAEVIRVAALHGGTIDREEVYEICGYEDDRMLRGFTLPTSRITRDLQQEGIVAEGVEPVLTTIYRGGVKAAAFRIPAEMAAILTKDQASEAVE